MKEGHNFNGCLTGRKDSMCSIDLFITHNDIHKSIAFVATFNIEGFLQIDSQTLAWKLQTPDSTHIHLFLYHLYTKLIKVNDWLNIETKYSLFHIFIRNGISKLYYATIVSEKERKICS